MRLETGESIQVCPRTYAADKLPLTDAQTVSLGQENAFLIGSAYRTRGWVFPVQTVFALGDLQLALN